MIPTGAATYLGGDGNAALALEGYGVHGTLVGDVRPALSQESVHERRLPVVDVGDHRHVADAGWVPDAAGGESGRGGRGRRRRVEAAKEGRPQR
jgi:hypothetical protein